MSRYGRFTFFGTLLLVASVIAFQMMNQWYQGLHDPEKINFWVAFGTLALAVTTVVSVLETQLILSREDVGIKNLTHPS